MTWKRLDVKRLLPMAASLGLHVAIVGVILLGAGWGATPASVLLAELVVPEERPEPPPRVSKPRPVVPDRRPVSPPRPIETPVPSEPAPAPPRAEPEPPKPVVPEPPPAPPVAAPAPPVPAPVAPQAPAAAPAPPAGPSVRVPTSDQPVAAASTPTPGTFTAPLPPSPPGPSAPGRSSALAAVPSDGITQRALPRGGYQYRPSYPSSARSSGVQGTTLLEVLVTVDGRVTDVVVKESAGHPDLDQAAVDAVRRWRFEPARRGSDPVAMRVELPFEFRLRR